MPQSCASCRAQSPDGAKFCLECGSPLAVVCRSCGHPVVGGKFCIECGTPLVAAAVAASRPGSGPAEGPAVPAGPVSERRTTTVLFGDLVGFTTLSESRDPEEVRELLSTYFTAARTVVGRYGGTIEKFIGDAVMAVWGVPVSHEDDAERAVRAGLDLVKEVAALGSTVGAPDLALRVGIVTGSVAVTLGAVNEGMVAGDAVNTAARVQTAATPGTVWVDQETQGLTAAAVAFSDMGEHALKGKAEPMRLFRADMVVAAVGGAQRVDGLQAPMTGRDADLRALKGLFHATESDGRARLVAVTGIAGIGKSRLGWEFDTYTDALSDVLFWYRGRCLSYGEGVAFWAFAEMIRTRLRIVESDDRAVVEEKTWAGASRVAATEDEAAWLAPRLLALVSGGGSGAFDRTDLFVAWSTFLDRVAGQQPIVLLFEDVQHADDALLDLIEHLVRTTRARLFVVLLARPELVERRPSLLTGRSTSLLELRPLPDSAMAALLDGLVQDLPVDARDVLATRAEGVPLYAVETVRSLIDRDAVVAREGRYVFVDHDHQRVDLDRLSAPTSLHTMIAARLDTLSPVERRTVQDAAVLGLSFRYSGLLALAEVSSYELDTALESLATKGVIELRDESGSVESGEHRFLQAMVREVAYSTLARSDRRARHLAAAAHLERETLDSAELIAGIVAQHLLDALAASPERDPERPELTERARRLLTLAAAAAEALGSPEQALAQLQSALELDPEPLERAELEEVAARAARSAGRYALGEELAARAVAGYEQLAPGAAVVRALMEQARLVQRLGRPSETEELAQRGQRIAEGLEGVPLQVRCELHWLRFTSNYSRGEFDGQMEHVLAGMRLAEELQDPQVLLRGLSLLSLAMIGAGVPAGQRAVAERCIVLAREGHDLFALSDALTGLCSDLYAEDLSAATSLALEAVAVARQVGERYATEISLINAGYIWWLTGDWDRLLAETSDWLTGAEPSTTSGGLWMARIQVRLARGLGPEVVVIPPSEDYYDRQAAGVAAALASAAAGESAAAAFAAATITLETFSSGDNRGEDFEMLWSPAVELQLAAGDLDTAAALLALADPLLGGRGRPLTHALVPHFRGRLALLRGEDPEADLRDAETRLVAYGAPYLLARTRLELGRWLLGQDRAEEAQSLLAQARAVFVELRATPSVEAVDELLILEPVQS